MGNVIESNVVINWGTFIMIVTMWNIDHPKLTTSEWISFPRVGYRFQEEQVELPVLWSPILPKQFEAIRSSG